MAATYNCLSCGRTLPADQVPPGAATVRCPSCGRDMYRSEPSGASPGGELVLGPRSQASVQPAVPSRYRSAGMDSPYGMELEDEDDEFGPNPLIRPHTPFVVILGFIFSIIMGPIGLVISIIGLRLVNQSKGTLRGRGLAIAGIVIGALMTALYIYARVVGLE